MNERLSQDRTYVEVFENIKEVKVFFATKNTAKIGWPFYNEELFEEVGLADVIHVGHQQTHSDHINVVTSEDVEAFGRGEFASRYDRYNEALDNFTSEGYKGDGILYLDSDGALTDVKGVMLTTLHADCIPLFFYDPKKEVIGMVHSGWKGTVKEIGRVAVLKMQEVYGCEPGDVLVHIGPGISECCFEIDEDVYEMFKEPKYVKKGSKYYVDLKHYNKRMLMDVGIDEDHITISDHCTCCEDDLFESYRRDGSKFRMGGGICMLED